MSRKKTETIHYTRSQIEKLGIRPRVRGKGGNLLPCEVRECKAVVSSIVSSKDDDLYEYWRLIPFEEGDACNLRKRYETWVRDEVESLWYDIGRPVFDADGSWFCPEGGWWPYMAHPYLDVSSIKVGSALIDMDEIYMTLKGYLKEKIDGYRMCPGMKLYRVMMKVSAVSRRIDDAKTQKLPVMTIDDMRKCRDDLMEVAMRLVDDHPNKETENTPDREWFSPDIERNFPVNLIRRSADGQIKK